MRDGKGTCKRHDCTYDGRWADGEENGRGVLKWANGDTYDGEWLNGIVDGWGVYRCSGSDGSSFEGLYRDNMRKRGAWHDRSGAEVKDGDWVFGTTGSEMQGWGVQRRKRAADKSATTTMMETVFEGEWDRDKWHGRGTWRSHEGEIYNGMFDHGKRSGTGSMLFGGDGGERGGSYVGEWKDDMFHGRGVRLWANGDSLKCMDWGFCRSLGRVL
ncbi:hypothetical protein Pelo_19356 [Pelomyxa schiedti]|nr:hypothetical protein Pelo_19356 [Pelomyxa schiedti]